MNNFFLPLLPSVCLHAAVQSTGFCFGPATKMATEAKMLRNCCAVKLSILYAGLHFASYKEILGEVHTAWEKWLKSVHFSLYEHPYESDV